MTTQMDSETYIDKFCERALVVLHRKLGTPELRVALDMYLLLFRFGYDDYDDEEFDTVYGLCSKVYHDHQLTIA